MRGLGDQLAVAGATIDVVVQGIRVAFNGLQTAVFGIATAITGAFTVGAKGVALYLEALALIPLAGRLVTQAVTEANNAVGGLAAVTEEFASRAKANLDETSKAAADFETASAKLAAASEKAAAGIGQVGDAAGEMAPKVQEAGNQLGLVPDYMKEAEQSSVGVVKKFNVVGDAAERMARQQAAAADASREHVRALEAARDRAESAGAALRALSDAGQTNTTAFKVLSNEFLQASAELDRLRGKAEQTAPSLKDLEADATKLGITLSAQLEEKAAEREAALDRLAQKLGQAGIASGDTKKAFEAWAASARAATAEADAATQAETERAIASKQTALGLSDSVKASSAAVASAAQTAADGLKQTAGAAQQAGDAAKAVGTKAKEGAEEAGGAANVLSNAIQANRNQFLGLSEGAAKAFDSILEGLTKTQVSFNTQQALGEFLFTIEDAANQTRDAIDRQRQSLESQIGLLNQLGTAGSEAFQGTADSADQTLLRLDALKQGIAEGTVGFDLLGSQDLSALNSAIDGARQRLERLQEEAKAAEESLSNLGSTLQDQIDQINGNKTDIENRRFEEQLKQIDELAKKSGAAGAEEAAKARARAEELHRLNLQHIQEEDAARKKSNGGGGNGGNDGGGDGAPTGGGGGRPRGGGGSGSSGGVTIHVNGSVLGSNPQELAEALARIIKPQLDAINRRSL